MDSNLYWERRKEGKKNAFLILHPLPTSQSPWRGTQAIPTWWPLDIGHYRSHLSDWSEFETEQATFSEGMVCKFPPSCRSPCAQVGREPPSLLPRDRHGSFFPLSVGHHTEQNARLRFKVVSLTFALVLSSIFLTSLSEVLPFPVFSYLPILISLYFVSHFPN